jgi:hypothetical protein
MAESPDGGAPSGSEPAVEAPVHIEGWHLAVFPIGAYGSDIGLKLGAALFFYRPLRDYPEERDELSLSLSYATRGPRQLDLAGGARHLFRTSVQVGWNLHLGDDQQMPYWGEGAQLGGLLTPPGFGSPPEPYRYHDRRLFAALLLRGAIVGPLGLHLRARWLTVDVAEPSELLTTSAPPGVRGGRVALGEVGLLIDTRDRELGTRRGLFATVAAFAAPQLGGVSDFSFHGYDASVRFYVPLPFGATIALRGLYDRKIAGVPTRSDPNPAVPFFERMLFEGIRFDEGLGGASTVRGIARFRLAGEEKMLANAELRVHVVTTNLFGKLQEWGLGVGIDAGRAWQPGYDAVHAESIAGGIRMVWDRAILARIEIGRTRGGENALYVSFGEMF